MKNVPNGLPSSLKKELEMRKKDDFILQDNSSQSLHKYKENEDIQWELDNSNEEVDLSLSKDADNSNDVSGYEHQDTSNQSSHNLFNNSRSFSRTGMDYRTWLQQRKKQDQEDISEDALGSKFELTRKTNSTILEESSKAEDDDSVIEKPTHRQKKSNTINPMLLLTTSDQTSVRNPSSRDLAKEKDSSSHIDQTQNSFGKKYLNMSSFRSSNASGIQSAYLAQNSKYNSDQTYQSNSQAISYQNGTHSSGISQEDAPSQTSNINGKLKNTIHCHYNIGNMSDHSTSDMVMHTSSDARPEHTRSGESLMNIHTQSFGATDNNEEINTLQAIKQTTFGRINHDSQEFSNISNSFVPYGMQTNDQYSTLQGNNFQYADNSQNFYSETSRFSNPNQSNYSSQISHLSGPYSLEDNESQLLQNNQENYNSMNMSPQYQPFNQRFIVKEQIRMREPAIQSKKFDYQPPQLPPNPGESFKMTYYNQSKNITTKMRERVMKMIEEKNANTEPELSSRNSCFKPPVKGKSRNLMKQPSLFSFSNTSCEVANNSKENVSKKPKQKKTDRVFQSFSYKKREPKYSEMVKNYGTQRSKVGNFKNSGGSVKRSKGVNISLNNSMARSERSSNTKRPKSESKNKPKFKELGILKRNQDWLACKERKLTAERAKKKAHETDGCTFEPKINKYKSKNNLKLSSRTSTSVGAKTNRSYSEIHRNKYSKAGSMNTSMRSETCKSTTREEVKMLDLSLRDYREEKFDPKFNTVSLEPILPDANLNTLENSCIEPKTQTYDSSYESLILNKSYTHQKKEKKMNTPAIPKLPPRFIKKKLDPKRKNKVINLGHLQKQLSERSLSRDSKNGQKEPIRQEYMSQSQEQTGFKSFNNGEQATIFEQERKSPSFAPDIDAQGNYEHNPHLEASYTSVSQMTTESAIVNRLQEEILNSNARTSRRGRYITRKERLNNRLVDISNTSTEYDLDQYKHRLEESKKMVERLRTKNTC
ncbi:unnamed protein product [Moneuplotes crassus]|uniref:Uncharacterized protein n=1 Tax=Euplotes crassus TaxID=5936 RepID=A0AAD1XU44_EUPCR|nr:unnamed protein product [Moneuplotes crassus]